jgi:hypothetical protein
MAKQKKQRLMRSLRQQGRHAARTGQVRVQDARTGKIEMVNVEDIRTALDLSADECREAATRRVTLNQRETMHPFHHKTADGTIVTPDPTLEYYLSRLSQEAVRKVRRHASACT